MEGVCAAGSGAAGSTLMGRPVSESEVIFDWNGLDRLGPLTAKKIELMDESLRDGIQSPSAIDPPVSDKIEILHLMNDLGIDVADLGLPGAGPRAFNDVLTLVKEISREKMTIKAACAGRTVVGDIRPMAEIAQKTGVPLEVYTFIGSSPIRQYAEEWDLDTLLRRSEEAIDFAVHEGLPVAYVTEDTTRSTPKVLDRLFRHAIDRGASRLCLCDTVGHATPDGVRRLFTFARDLIRGVGADVKLDWHGHNDRGLGLCNALFSIEYGVDRIHGCGAGIGERVGNAAMDQILMNMKLMGLIDRDLSKLNRYTQKVAAATGYQIPVNYPLAGRDAFRTATGVHAAAIIKARNKGEQWLADRIYSGVPATEFGKEQQIEIGPMSGISNVTSWLVQHGITGEDGLVRVLLARAKAANHTLSQDEVLEAVREYRTVEPVAANH
jgi:2-isopropylmalate synthase